MFETFSKAFESYFRIIFIIWVCFWGFFNISELLLKYASFRSSSNQNPNDLGYWWLTTLGQVVTIAVGVTLLFFMSNIPAVIQKKKKVSNIGLMTGLAVVYYLFVTVMQTFASAIFKGEDFAREFVFLSAWLFPSIIFLVIHILYFTNLRTYNRELEEVK